MNIYVSNLSFNVQDEDLREFFTPYGEVTSAKIITDRESGSSRGFGFVEMSVMKLLPKKLSQNWTSATVEGRTIKVMEAKPKEDRGGGGSYGKGDRNYNSSNSYNKNRY